jgi:hypothetical protein
MYYVTKHVVPKEHVAAWAWIIGWCNFLGQAAGVASLAYTISQMILATAVMHTLDQGEAAFTPYVAIQLLLAKTNKDSTPLQTVLLAILVLCLFGTICSFPTEWLHKIILWFAPINSKTAQALSRNYTDPSNSRGFDMYLHCATRAHTEQAERKVGLWRIHGRFRMGQQGILFPAWVRISAQIIMNGAPNISRFLSVAWTMTDYDGTTQ